MTLDGPLAMWNRSARILKIRNCDERGTCVAPFWSILILKSWTTWVVRLGPRLSASPCRAHDTVYTVAMHPASGAYVTRANGWEPDTEDLMLSRVKPEPPVHPTLRFHTVSCMIYGSFVF